MFLVDFGNKDRDYTGTPLTQFYPKIPLILLDESGGNISVMKW